MKAFIPPELLDLVPLPVVIVLEQVTDVVRMEMLVPHESETQTIRQGRQLSLSGSKFETFLALVQAGARASWSAHGVEGWMVSFYAESEAQRAL